MKQKILKLAVLSAISAIAIPATADVTLYDYTEATSAFEDAYLSANANLGRTRKDDQASYKVTVNGNYNKVISTPKRDTTFKLNADGQVSRSGVKDAKSVNSYLIGGSSTIDTYFREGSKGAFWFGKIDVNKRSNKKRVAKLGIGVGYGRVVNVTPMAKAIRLVEALNYRGSIHGKPSKAVHNQIANIIARESEYASKHGRKDYQKYWIADIEAALRSSGVLSGNLNAAGVLKARDVLVDERISTRKLGWKVRAGLNVVREGASNSKPGLELGAEYHLPLSNRTQFSDEATLSTIFDNDLSDAYAFLNKMTLTHEIDDRIDWENSWTLAYNKLDGGARNTTNTLSSTFLYELTNSLDYSIEAKVTNTDATGTINDGTDRSLNMGIRYRLK